MFMVHFMRPAYSSHIIIIAAGKPFEPLVNNYVMQQEVCKPISHNTKADCLQPPYMPESAKPDQQYTGCRKDEEEGVILFKKSRFRLVMIFVQIPQKPMHNKPMCTPCNCFHYYKCSKQYQYVKNCGH